MAGFTNVGAMHGNGQPIKTKTALKQLFLDAAWDVVLYSTTFWKPGTWKGSDLPQDTIFSVVGPDPERSRKWYATIEFKNGKWVVS